MGHGPTVFISYRRDDAAASAGRLFDWLARQFGRSRIFLDTDKIASGDAFPRKLEERLAASEVLLAVIGPRWLTISDGRGRRIDQPDDFVRREIASALDRSMRIVPVLVGGARMPREDELPDPLKALARRNAASIDDAKFERDFDLLVDDLLGRSRGFVSRQVDRVQRVVYVAKWSLLLVPALAVGFALAVWTHLLDYFTLDSRVAGYVIRAADAVWPPPAEPPVLIAGIDAATEAKLGRKFGPAPEWRRDHARLIERAAKAGAAAVAFDLFFEQDSEMDGELAQAARLARGAPRPMRVVFAVRRLQGERPVLATALRDDRGWGSVCLFERLGRFDAPLAVLRDPGGATDFFTATTPALALAAACDEPLNAVDVERRQIVSGACQARYSTVERMGSRGRDCQAYQPDDDVAMLFIRQSPPGYWRDPGRMVSYADLFDPRAVPDERLRGRIVLVGAVKPGQDEHEARRGLASEVIHGVELHADAISNLLTRRVVTTPAVGRQFGITIAMVLAGAGASVFSATASRAARRSLLGAAAAVYVLGTLALAGTGLLLNVHYDLAAFFAAHALLRRLQAPRIRATAEENPG